MIDTQSKTTKRVPLIDFGTSPSVKIIRDSELHERMMWLIHLRWLATAGLFLGYVIGHYLLNVQLLTVPLLTLSFTLGLYNLVVHLITSRMSVKTTQRLHLTANMQISIDLLLLTLLLHYSGGIENPFVISYIYHMILASILLTAKAAYLQAIWATTLIGAQTILTQSGLVSQPHLDGFLSIALFNQSKYVWSFYGVMTFTLFLVVYMTSSISKEIKAREEKLEDTNKLLQEKDRLKSEYVLALSHDLKQPLAAAQTNLRVILDGYAGEVNTTVKKMIARAERRVIQLLDIIRDLLNLSKITSLRSIQKSEINLVGLLKDVVQRAEELAKDKHQNFSVNFPDHEIIVTANYDMLRQAVWNLIENAIKYTPDQGSIAITVLRTDSEIELVIEDTGIGVPPEEADSVFGDFYRSPNAKSFDETGTGLGLAIVKHVFEVHGAKIQLQSPRPNCENLEFPGTRFKVLIPRNKLKGSNT